MVQEGEVRRVEEWGMRKIERRIRGRCSASGLGDSMYTEREVVVATGASEYLNERALDEEEERTITEFVRNGCGCRMGIRGPALQCS